MAKSGSNLSWIKIKPEKLKKIVVDLAKEGHLPAKIGLILRDEYGIPKAKIMGKKITKILEEEKIPYKKEKDINDEKIEKLRIHLKNNKHDYTASKALTKRLWILNHFNKKSN